MRIYHGSCDEIIKPIYGAGKPYNDYGLGFYCTQDADMAREWASAEDRNGILNGYELDLDGLNVLRLSEEPYCIIHWLTVLLENRTFDVRTDFGQEAKDYLLTNFASEYREADVIVGYRADDRYFSFAQDFLNNNISVKSLNNAMQLGNLGEQVVLKSTKAFERIEFMESEPVLSSIWFPRKHNRDEKARTDYDEIRRQPWQRGEVYILQMLEEEMKNDDVRLRF